MIDPARLRPPLSMSDRGVTDILVADLFSSSQLYGEAVADQHQTQNQLIQGISGDWQMKPNIIIPLGRCKRLIQRLLGFLALLVDECPADLMLVCQVGDWNGASQRLDSALLASCRG